MRAELERIESERAALARRRAQERAQAEAEADSERTVARTYAERYDYAAALEHFEAAIEVAPEDWQFRKEVTRDIDAIRDWLAQEHSNETGGSK